MQFQQIQLSVQNIPELDPDYIPLYRFNRAFLETARQPFTIAVERNDGQIAVFPTFVHGDAEHGAADYYYIERLVKTLLWQKGGFRVYLTGKETVCDSVRCAYAPGGERAFDASFMARMYGQPFEVVRCEKPPKAYDLPKSVGRHLDGCRIGFDAGGSDRKVSAVVDGEAVYSEETVWHPKVNADPDYHFNGIVAALKEAAKHMPRVDAIGVSSAGIYANNRVLYAQLFQKVTKEEFDQKIRDIYPRAAREIGADIPIEVANDGDVTALAGSMSMERNNVLGIAMGTSQAVGYVDAAGNITGWLNELAFAPVDASPNAAVDDWTGDIGCGYKYFSQEAVIRLAPVAGISLESYGTPAEKLSAVQEWMAKGDERAAAIYRSIGCYLGHSAALYADQYGAEVILLLGRVMSGEGGGIIVDIANRVLASEYPDLKMELALPDEKMRRVGQSVAAASLPELAK